MDVKEYMRSVRKLNDPRKTVISNSYGLNDAYKYFKKNKPEHLKHSISRADFGRAVRAVNLILRDMLLNSKDIIFPEGMGGLELRKVKARIQFQNNWLRTNLRVNWNETLKLWYEDEEARKNKKLVRYETDELFRVFYNRGFIRHKNSWYFRWLTNRNFKKLLKEKVKNKEVEAEYIYIEYGKDHYHTKSDR